MTEQGYTAWVKVLINKSMMDPEPGEKEIEIEEIIEAVVNAARASKEKLPLIKEQGLPFTEDEVLIKYTMQYLDGIKNEKPMPPTKKAEYPMYKVGDRVVVRGDVDDRVVVRGDVDDDEDDIFILGTIKKRYSKKAVVVFDRDRLRDGYKGDKVDITRIYDYGQEQHYAEYIEEKEINEYTSSVAINIS